MVTHSSILAWRIPWMEKTGRLQSDMAERLHFHFQQRAIQLIFITSTV